MRDETPASGLAMAVTSPYRGGMRTSGHSASVAGLLGVAVVVVGTLAAAAAFPGYDHARQYISELGARGAPHGAVVSYGMFLPAGLLLVAFAGLAIRALPRAWLTRAGMLGVAAYACGYLVAVPFPCDPGCRPEQPSLSQLIHSTAGGISYLLGAAGLVLLGIAARRWPGATHLCVFGIAGGVLSLAALTGLSPGFPLAGVAQRLIEGSMLGWISLCALYLRRPHGLRAASSRAGSAGIS